MYFANKQIMMMMMIKMMMITQRLSLLPSFAAFLY